MKIFSLNRPLGCFGLVVAMSVPEVRSVCPLKKHFLGPWNGVCVPRPWTGACVCCPRVEPVKRGRVPNWTRHPPFLTVIDRF